jgi:hypothetical protein
LHPEKRISVVKVGCFIWQKEIKILLLDANLRSYMRNKYTIKSKALIFYPLTLFIIHFRMKESCLTSTQGNEKGGIVGQISDNQDFLVFNF